MTLTDMQVFMLDDNQMVLRGDKSAEPKFRVPLSKDIVSGFGRPPYTIETTKKILLFIKERYIAEFEKIIAGEKSYSFYKQVLTLHEQATNIRVTKQFNSLPEGLDKGYFAGYRRILKMILEQACTVEMVRGEKMDQQFIQRISPILNDLFFLGDMLATISESLAEQEMIEDVMEVSFDEKNCYVLSRKHHYEFIFRHIANKLETEEQNFIIDKNAGADFRTAVLDNFGIDYDHILQASIILMDQWKLKMGEAICASADKFSKFIQEYAEKQLEHMDLFLSGLTLSRDNKIPLTELLRKPYALNRYLYRPFLLWSVDKIPYYVFGWVSLQEIENSLHLNAIPWGKIPDEWKVNKGFVKYMNRKEDEHDKWLDDVVEEKIKDAKVIYQRTVKSLNGKHKSYSLINGGPGEIDFLILSQHTKKVYIAECKHLLGRYDMVNQLNDFDYFTKDSNRKLCYNNRLKLKTDWINSNLTVVEEHFRIREKKYELSLKGYSVEGLFFINSPTFYMYNSLYRIYTYDLVTDVLTGDHVDPLFNCVVDDDESQTFYNIGYPYFRKTKTALLL
jgi:hypothetical protein